MKPLPKQADVVIIGGGIVGCSIAYHLTKIGITNVVVLERKQLTSGTTWHAAGLVGQLRASRNLTELAKYTAGLFEGLEKETGQATGFKQNGSISLALNDGRYEELLRGASMAKAFCVDTAVECCHQGIQVHGGMGFTWELGLHHYLRRARIFAATFGNSDFHRERVVAATLKQSAPAVENTRSAA